MSAWSSYQAFEQVCLHRGWSIFAAHVRTNHVHVVLAANAPAGRVRGDLKAWATRRLVAAGHRLQGQPIWVRQGSKRQLWRPRAIDAACFYVVHEQGEILRGTVSPAP
jgi:REP element-mobilizing transposase RayT